ncbi:hypothetical protein EHQ16_02820 [Leptospira kanakyensis]|uniref:Uncharacterized protein n=1 Tax=Leptospira kanakyensis TaxID=2484968 RepID=A0A6N4Q069_9LEPT|nr:hypothetical protein [Leptospira kanakyensis]TGK47591.1 hypothetical protein EHQ11_16810 [Leptospira kanakyensis]TGK63405.1 hypothetical protein EHQ16_02820 [Leptospira kanakyensis]TGK67009.1 hypothetical protein EHQ18_18055 [Leptospira kanakyensis]
MNSLDLNDLPFLKEESLRVYRWLLVQFPELDTLETNESFQFPLRWMTEQKGQRFEWVVSDMGSVTLRLGGLEGNRRNPAPIFYLSLRKLDGDVFHWTDPEGNPVPFPDPSILIDIQNRIQLYLDSVS